METDYYVIRVGKKLYLKKSDILCSNEGDAVLTGLNRAMIGQKNKWLKQIKKLVGNYSS